MSEQQTSISGVMSLKDTFKTSFKISLLIFYIVIIIYLSFMIRFLQQYYNIREIKQQPSTEEIESDIKKIISASDDYGKLLNIQQKCPENLFSINSSDTVTKLQQYLDNNENLLKSKEDRITLQTAKSDAEKKLVSASTDEQKVALTEQVVSLNLQINTLNNDITTLEKNIVSSPMHACIGEMSKLSKLNIVNSIKNTKVGCLSEGSLSENKRCQYYSLNSYKHIMIVIWVVQIVVFLYTLYWLYSHRSTLLTFHKIQSGLMGLNMLIIFVIVGLSAGAFVNYKKYPADTITIGNITYNCKEFTGGVSGKSFTTMTISLLSFLVIQLVIIMMFV